MLGCLVHQPGSASDDPLQGSGLSGGDTGLVQTLQMKKRDPGQQLATMRSLDVRGRRYRPRMKLAIGDLLYPQQCLGCGLLVRGGVCGKCTEAVTRITGEVCVRCGAPRAPRNATCRWCPIPQAAFDRAYQSVMFTGLVRRAIHRFKYTSEAALLDWLVSLVDISSIEDIQAITWVPVPRERILTRGFDHAELIAQRVAAKAGLPIVSLLRRTRRVARQVELPTDERKVNLAGAFAPVRPSPSAVLLVDDVFTTGATAHACADALKSGGSDRVDVLTIARALPAARMADL